MLKLEVDNNLNDVHRWLNGIERNLGDKVVVRSINKVAGKARTIGKREIARAGGFKSSYVHERLKLTKAHRGRFLAELTGRGRHTLLTQFSPTPKPENGGPWRRAKPWGETRKYARGFYVHGKNGVLLPVTRQGRGRHNYHVKYGPSVGKVFGKEAMQPVRDHVNRELPREAARYAEILLHKRRYL